MTIDFDPFVTDWRHDPFPIYAAMREQAPVYVSEPSQTWCISRYDDVLHVLKHPELFSSGVMQRLLMSFNMGRFRLRYLKTLARFAWDTRMQPLAISRAPNLITLDPPRHDAVRSIVNRGFAPRRIAAWEPRIREIVAEELGGIETGADMDVVRDLAVPLPTRVIAEMLGIDPARRADFKRWSNSIIAVASGPGREDPLAHGFLENVGALFSFLRDTVRERRGKPGDDLVSALVDPGQGESLSEAEMIQFVLLLLLAGNETTTNLIGNGVNALLDHPDQLDLLLRDPALVPGLIDEALRYDSPVQLVFREALEPTEIAGTRIPKGATLCVLIGSANRDERRFSDADRFDVTRGDRGHLAFGFGAHFCLGSALARLEATAAFEGVLPLLAGYRRVDDRPPIIDSFLVRGRQSLELEAA
jgi:cytochrome P450